MIKSRTSTTPSKTDHGLAKHHEKESFVRAFNKIADPKVRKDLLELVKSTAKASTVNAKIM
tara:strand:- start:223 stop:405 length:183 start_codon:yes stop_codon:yes gene_type:complete